MPKREQFEALLKTDPDDVFLNYGLALHDVNAGSVEAGLARFARVIELDPQYVAAYFMAAQAEQKRGNTEACRDLLQRGIAVAQRIGNDHAAGEMQGLLMTLD